MPIYLNFVHHFNQALWKIRIIFLGMITLLVVDAAAIAGFEKMPFADALYFTFVTGLTIGYGDIAPVILLGRIVAILTGLQGILVTGLVTAVAVYALKRTMEYPTEST